MQVIAIDKLIKKNGQTGILQIKYAAFLGAVGYRNVEWLKQCYL